MGIKTLGGISRIYINRLVSLGSREVFLRLKLEEWSLQAVRKEFFCQPIIKPLISRLSAWPKSIYYKKKNRSQNLQMLPMQ